MSLFCLYLTISLPIEQYIHPSGFSYPAPLPPKVSGLGDWGWAKWPGRLHMASFSSRCRGFLRSVPCVCMRVCPCVCVCVWWCELISPQIRRPVDSLSRSLYQKYAIFLRIINARCMQHDQRAQFPLPLIYPLHACIATSHTRPSPGAKYQPLDLEPKKIKKTMMCAERANRTTRTLAISQGVSVLVGAEARKSSRLARRPHHPLQLSGLGGT